MNIFYLDKDPKICAMYHADKHVLKMSIEYAQLLSVSHRVIDGHACYQISNNRKYNRYVLNDSVLDNTLYKSTHVNHPSAIWARTNSCNYKYLFDLWVNVLGEYTFRYGKIHKSSNLIKYLKDHPKNIKITQSVTAVPLAMPSIYFVDQDGADYSIDSYRNYYNLGKQHLHSWKNRPIPAFVKD